MRENCINCGAPLHYNDDDLICKCQYCSTEYHLKKEKTTIGNINEYEVELDIAGKKRKYYIGSIEAAPIIFSTYRDINGKLCCTHSDMKTKIKLIEI